MTSRASQVRNQTTELAARHGRGAWTPTADERTLAADVLSAVDSGRLWRDAITDGLRAGSQRDRPATPHDPGPPAEAPLRLLLVSAGKLAGTDPRHALLQPTTQADSLPALLHRIAGLPDDGAAVAAVRI